VEGVKLFGNFTPLGNGKNAGNGFEALKELDSNHDGVIDDRDDIWPQLQLWRDLNHDGISEPNEMQPLSQSFVVAIGLAYHWTGRRDVWGNAFKYQSEVWLSDGSRRTRVKPLYDVFFVRVQ